jgi:hypothetical protein
MTVEENQINSIQHIIPFGEGFLATDDKFELYFFEKNYKDIK